MNKPIIAILGKPNVGKSTLFNRFVGKRQSIVSHIEGVTRDRIYGEFDWLNNIYSLIDTGGYIPKSKNVIDQQVNFQAEVGYQDLEVSNQKLFQIRIEEHFQNLHLSQNLHLLQVILNEENLLSKEQQNDLKEMIIKIRKH